MELIILGNDNVIRNIYFSFIVIKRVNCIGLGASRVLLSMTPLGCVFTAPNIYSLSFTHNVRSCIELHCGHFDIRTYDGPLL
jgi:hypothetical protein